MSCETIAQVGEPQSALPEYLLWCAALSLYIDDARNFAALGRSGDKGQAWRDIRSPECPRLTWLCAHVDYDARWLQKRLAKELQQ